MLHRPDRSRWRGHQRQGRNPSRPPPCDTYLDELPGIKNCAELKLAHPDSLACWNSSENYRTAVTAWEAQWDALECDVFE